MHTICEANISTMVLINILQNVVVHSQILREDMNRRAVKVERSMSQFHVHNAVNVGRAKRLPVDQSCMYVRANHCKFPSRLTVFGSPVPHNLDGGELQWFCELIMMHSVTMNAGRRIVHLDSAAAF
jgi:hypothetical protein